jgi:hypothetical protein
MKQKKALMGVRSAPTSAQQNNKPMSAYFLLCLLYLLAWIFAGLKSAVTQLKWFKTESKTRG